MDPHDDKQKCFLIYFPGRSYYLYADSHSSAVQWVKQLQKIIFKTRNQGTNVKISIPIANVLELEEVHLLGSSDTLKLTALDNDETFAMDEFYFSFFGRTREAFEKLQSCLSGNTDEAPPLQQDRERTMSGESTRFSDSVKDTTTYIRSVSPNTELLEEGTHRRSFDAPRQQQSDRRSSPEMKRSSFGEETQSASSRRPSLLPSFREGLPLMTGNRSRTPSPLRSSFDSIDRPSYESLAESAGGTSPSEERSWSDRGKMLWSRGINVADWMRQRSAEVGTMLATPTSTINAGVGKVSQLWTGEYLKSEQAKWISEETAKDMKDQNPEERFQSHFALPPSEKLQGTYYGYVFRTFPFYGKAYISQRYFCFRSLLPGIKTKVHLR
jgi:sterol 3beta-glucosyltransferase